MNPTEYPQNIDHEQRRLFGGATRLPSPRPSSPGRTRRSHRRFRPRHLGRDDLLERQEGADESAALAGQTAQS